MFKRYNTVLHFKLLPNVDHILHSKSIAECCRWSLVLFHSSSSKQWPWNQLWIQPSLCQLWTYLIVMYKSCKLYPWTFKRFIQCLSSYRVSSKVFLTLNDKHFLTVAFSTSASLILKTLSNLISDIFEGNCFGFPSLSFSNQPATMSPPVS